jgi:catechol 2,3-dioxygenase-like lactoylglutathione lyase family enzyme
MFTPLGLDHVVLVVKDQQASQRFYTDVLGCTVDHVNERISLIHLRFGEAYIDLLPVTAERPRGAGGVDHICLSIKCDDLEKLSADLKARGVPLEGGISTRRGAYGTGPSLYVRDPDGYMVELKPR